MLKQRTALSVLVGCIAFATVAWTSLSVEGEATGTMVPGLHATTEAAVATLLGEGWDRPPAVPVESATQGKTDAQPGNQAATAATAKPKVAPTGVPEGYAYWKTVRAKVTAYEPGKRSCGKYADGKTSIGQNAWVMDGVATDPKAIPYGSYVVIPGVGAKQVDDTGKAMRDSWQRHGRYHIDLRMPYHSQATRWGVKYLDVKVYTKAR